MRNGNCTTDFGLFSLAIKLAHHGQLTQDLAPGFGFKSLQNLICIMYVNLYLYTENHQLTKLKTIKTNYNCFT